MRETHSHARVVSILKTHLLDNGHQELSTKGWIPGPVDVDIMSRSEFENSSYPIVTVIAVKTESPDHQRALYQLLLARERLSYTNQDVCAKFYAALSKQLWEQLERFNERDDFLMLMSDPLAELTVIDRFEGETREQRQFGIGVLVVDETSGRIRKIRDAEAYMFKQYIDYEKGI